jgi:hypothetical protein
MNLDEVELKIKEAIQSQQPVWLGVWADIAGDYPVWLTLGNKPAQRTEQEPVIFCMHWEDRWGCNHYVDPKEPHPVDAKPLYTHPPQRTWVWLTNEEHQKIIDAHFSAQEMLIAAETKSKEKNGYAEEKNT